MLYIMIYVQILLKHHTIMDLAKSTSVTGSLSSVQVAGLSATPIQEWRQQTVQWQEENVCSLFFVSALLHGLP